MKRVACLLCLMPFLAIPHAATAADGVPVDVSGGYSYLHDQDASSNVPSGWTQSDFRAVRVSGATSKQERVAAGIVFKP